MITIDCAERIIALARGHCPGTPTKAVLQRRHALDVALDITLDADTLILGPVPTGTCHGQWDLSISTDCGCFQLPVHIAQCSAPALIPIHTPTPNRDRTSIECCPEEP